MIGGSSALFGLDDSNRDFTKVENWGKNIFTNAFPASLACYMDSKGADFQPVYLKLEENLGVTKQHIQVSELFGMKPQTNGLRFEFETDYVPYRLLVANGNLPKTDLVTIDSKQATYSPLRAIEVKLTAVPDNSTLRTQDEKLYSSEIVVRPDTIVYLAISVARHFQNDRNPLLELLQPVCKQIKDWVDEETIETYLPHLIEVLNQTIRIIHDRQDPLVLQPIWKTEGPRLLLAENCLDIFVWSDLAFTRLFIDAISSELKGKVGRHGRTVIWLARMLYDYALDGKIDHKTIFKTLNYATRNDKAFSVPGTKTHAYLSCEQLHRPRITRTEIKNIILNGGHLNLRPERRLDAAILTTPGLFDER